MVDQIRERQLFHLVLKIASAGRIGESSYSVVHKMSLLQCNNYINVHYNIKRVTLDLQIKNQATIRNRNIMAIVVQFKVQASG